MKKFKPIKATLIMLCISVLMVYTYGFVNYYVNADDNAFDEGREDDDLIAIIGFFTSNTPSKYDIRRKNPYGFSSHGNIDISVESQVGGTCWDYASMMALQTTIAKSNNSSIYPLLSKTHVDYMASKYSGKNYGGTREIGTGGGFGRALSYFKNNDGPVSNSKCFYSLYNNQYSNDRVTLNGTSYYCNTDSIKTAVASSMDKLTPEYYVHETVTYPGVHVKSTYGLFATPEMTLINTGEVITESQMAEIRNAVKSHILSKGGLYCSIRTHHYFIGNNLGSPYNTYDGRYSQYDDGSITGEVDGETPGGHAVTIIGWDDNYSRSKIYAKNSAGQIVHPSSDGAWLIVNSYGDTAFENGCQWISYEDYAVNANINGYISVNNSENRYTYTFDAQKAYEKMKGLTDAYGDGVSFNDNTKTVEGLDLIFNDFKSLNFARCELSNEDFNALLSNKLPKLNTLYVNNNNISNISALNNQKDNLKTIKLSRNNIRDISVLTKLTNVKYLDLSYNKISDVSSLDLSQYDNLNLQGQKIDVTVKPDVTEYNYPNIFVEAKNESSRLYSKIGFTFTGCREKADGTGVVLTSNSATVTIKGGEAENTTITITRTVDTVPPTIRMYYTNGGEISNGTIINNNTKIRFVFSDDNGIAGYNITNTLIAPTTWLTTYDQEPLQNVRIVTKTLSTIGQNYIWVKDVGGQTTRASLSVIFLGDVDGNEKINIRDIIKIRKYVANSTKWNLTNIEKTRADVTGDGKINIRDIIKIRKYIAASSNSSIAKKHPDWLW